MVDIAGFMVLLANVSISLAGIVVLALPMLLCFQYSWIWLLAYFLYPIVFFKLVGVIVETEIDDCEDTEDEDEDRRS